MAVSLRQGSTENMTTSTYCLFVCFWRNSLQWATASSFTMFLDHTHRRSTAGRNPLDEWSARRRDLYISTIKIRKWTINRGYSDSLRAGRFGDRIPVEVRCSTPVQTGPGAHPASYTLGTVTFPGRKRPGNGVNHPPHLEPRLKKE